MKRRRARAHTPGSRSLIQASFGPTAWDDSAEPHLRKTVSDPNSRFSRAICSSARVSTPYSTAGRTGSPASSTRRVHGPMPLTPTARTVTSSRSSNSAASETNSSHHTCASISTCPGRGRSTT